MFHHDLDYIAHGISGNVCLRSFRLYEILKTAWGREEHDHVHLVSITSESSRLNIWLPLSVRVMLQARPYG